MNLFQTLFAITQPTDRVQTASKLASRVRRTIARLECGGRALDLRLPQRCLFCGTGGYQALQSPLDR